MPTALALGFLFVAGTTAYVLLAGWAVAEGARAWWFVAAAPFVVGAIALAFALFHGTIAWVFRTPRPPGHRVGWAAGVRLLAEESMAVLVSWPRMIFFHWLARDPAPAPAAHPVLLVHGVLCNAGVWRGLRAHLAAQRLGPVYALSLAPPTASIDAFADQLAAKVDAVLHATGAPRVALVAHSMGGLVARAYLRRHGGDKVELVMTLGTPHHGSVHAWLFPGAALAQMRPGSGWLAELGRAEGERFPVHFVSLWSWHDTMVAPQTSARLAGAVNVELDGVGHNALLGEPRVYERVAAEIGRGLRAAAA
jgi:triacylglycerol esterase/lipase EstA (alpha/beta hydrolase family)